MQLVNIIEIVVSLLLVSVALLSVFSKETFNSVIFLSALSMLAVVSFALLRAPDVAVTEAVIGSGLSTFLFLMTIKHLKKEGN